MMSRARSGGWRLALVVGVLPACGQSPLHAPDAGAPPDAAADAATVAAGGAPAAGGSGGASVGGTGGAPPLGGAGGAAEEVFPASTVWRACASLGVPDQASDLAASLDGRYLAAGQYQTSIWDLSAGKLFRQLGSDGGLHPSFSFDSRLIALTGDARGVYRLADGSPLLETGNDLAGCIAWSSAGAFSPDGRSLALGTCSTVEIHPLDGSATTVLPSHVWSPGVAYSPDGRWLATSGPELWTADGKRRVWPETLVPGPPFMSLDSALFWLLDNTVTWAPDGTSLLVSNTESAPQRPYGAPWAAHTQLLRAADGSVLRDFGDELPHHPSLSPDGAWIVAGGRLLHLASGARATLADAVEVSIFLPDGRIAIAAANSPLQLFCPSLGAP